MMLLNNQPTNKNQNQTKPQMLCYAFLAGKQGAGPILDFGGDILSRGIR